MGYVCVSWHRFKLTCVHTHRFTRLGLEGRWTRHQSFPEMMVIIWTFKGVSNRRHTGSFGGDV